MPILNPKQPTEEVLYVLDLARIFKETEDVIDSYTLVVTAGTITVSNDWCTDTAVYALISGGANAETAALLLTVTTALNQVIKRTYTLSIANSATSVETSTSTKQTILEMAFEEAGLAGYEFDATSEEQASGLRRLDALMAEWNGPGVGLNLPYNFPAAMGGSDLTDASGIPDFALNSVAISLALRLYPALGKTMSTETRIALGNGLNAIRAACAILPTRQLPNSTLRGAGAKPASTWAPFNGVGNGGRG